MDDNIIFEFSKEGFESRFNSIEDTFNDSIFTQEEYDHFREGEMNEILFSKGSSNLMFWMILFFFIISFVFIIYGYLNHKPTILIPGLVTLIVTVIVGKDFLRFNKNRPSISTGDRQEVIDYLLNKKLISSDEAKFLQCELINVLSDE